MPLITLLMPVLLQASSVSEPPVTTTRPATAKPAASQTSATEEKKICKRFPGTGTLTGWQRICRTRAEWQASPVR